MVGRRVIALLFSVLLVLPFAAQARHTVSGAVVASGNDVSYPQCGKTLPRGQAFGVVGVNGGLANNFNTCFTTQLAWANASTGTTVQPKAQLYVNTANPGDVTPAVADWPKSSVAADPYGACSGANDVACSWQYGYDRATGDVSFVGSGAHNWWLDVETLNSWSSDFVKNRADLEGMVYGFTAAGGTVGIYSTTAQWQSIAGIVTNNSSLYTLADWRPGARTQSAALNNCHLTPLTTGGHNSIAQWTQSGLDSDVSCS